MNVLVINSGSSSLKYQLLETRENKVLAKGLCERIGIDGRLKHNKPGMEQLVRDVEMKDHKQAIKYVIDILIDPTYGVIADMSEIEACGHRIVHGGSYFSESVLVTDEVIKTLEEDCTAIAPLHTPGHVAGIKGCIEAMPDTPQVVVFDTAFHQTMPPKAYTYALPEMYYNKYKIRKYGFHGTSHKYVSGQAIAMLGGKAEGTKIVTCHLGNGSSLAAVKDGKCVDTSMGFTPLAGVIMGSRTGSMDPSVIPFIMEKESLTPDDVNNLINKESGVLAVSGVSSDFRDIELEADKGNARCQLALEMFEYQVAQYIASFAAAMGGVDCIVFTAGIGENNTLLREHVIDQLSFLGAKIDREKNKIRGQQVDVTGEGSKIKVFAIPTNEEYMIALDTERIASELVK